MGCNFPEGAFGAGDDIVSAQAFENLGELVQVATDHDICFLIAIAGVLGYEQSGFDVVRGDDDKMGMFHACIDERAFLLSVVHDHGLAAANEVVHNRRVFLDKNIGQSGLAEVFHQTASKMATANDDDVIPHFAGEHAASLLRIVALQGLKNENGDDNSEQNTLSPKRIKVGKLARVETEIERAKNGLT